MTPIELRVAALQEAGILASGEDAPPEDDQLVATKYAALYQMLLTDGLTAWAADEDIPTFAESALTMMLAAYIAPAFGITGQKMSELRLAGTLGLSPPSLAERMLRQQLTKRYVAHPVKVDFF